MLGLVGLECGAGLRADAERLLGLAPGVSCHFLLGRPGDAHRRGGAEFQRITFRKPKRSGDSSAL